MKIINPKNGEAFTSKFANNIQAHAALLARVTAEEFPVDRFPTAQFAGSICEKTTPKKGECPGSAGQIFWMHKLAHEGAERAPQKSAGSVDLTEIKDMLHTAKANGLKFPSLLLTTPKGLEVKVSLAGEQSKNPGAVYIASQGRGAYYGKVDRDGQFFTGRDYKPEVGLLLADMAKDPRGVASQQGHLTGKCCFCRKALTDANSTALGYGSTCARKFGLSHGAKAVAAKKAKNQNSGLRAPAANKVEKDLLGEEIKPRPSIRRIIRRRIGQA